MRVVSWNLNRRSAKSEEIWDYLIRKLDPDIALLQEVGKLSGKTWNLLGTGQCTFRCPLNKDGKPARFATGILTKGRIESNLNLTSRHPWVQTIYDESFTGNIVGCRVVLPDGESVNVVSVHSPWWHIDKEKWENVEEEEFLQVRLKENPDLWCTEILWSLLEGTPREGNWIVGGDLNFGLTFDYDSIAKGEGPRGNGEIIERMKGLGLVDCLSRHKKERVVPTFRSARAKTKIRHQLDYVYANPAMLDRLKKADVGQRSIVFAKSGLLSDHLPVICDFE